jgi:phytoene synthase
MSFDADLTACAALVERADPDRFAAAMASPLEARHVLFPLYAFNVEVSRAPWVTQESMIAEMRLQWWRDALEEIGQGGPVRRHEVVTPLGRVLDTESAGILDRLVAARRWDIYTDPFDDEAHFDSYLDDTAGGVMRVAARALGAVMSDDSDKLLRALGRATGLARFLQAVPKLEAQKRIPLVDGRAEAVAERARKALAACHSAVATRRRLTAEARPAVTEAFQTASILKQVVKDPRRVGEGRLSVHPLKRSALLWLWS